MTYVSVLVDPEMGREQYELRRNASRHGKRITRDEAQELISLPGTVRIRRTSTKDGFLSEVYELGAPGLRGTSNRSSFRDEGPQAETPAARIGAGSKEVCVSIETELGAQARCGGDPGEKNIAAVYTGHGLAPGTPVDNYGKLTEKRGVSNENCVLLAEKLKLAGAGLGPTTRLRECRGPHGGARRSTALRYMSIIPTTA